MIEINLLPHELRSKTKSSKITPNDFLFLIPLIFGIVIVLHILLAAIQIFKFAQFSLLNSKWRGLESQMKKMEGFQNEYTTLSQDAKLIQQLLDLRMMFSEKLNKLSRHLPAGVWFNDVVLTQKDFTLNGSIISLQKEEMALINKFMDNLKKDPEFIANFANLELSSVQSSVIGGYDVVNFLLKGSLK